MNWSERKERQLLLARGSEESMLFKAIFMKEIFREEIEGVC